MSQMQQYQQMVTAILAQNTALANSMKQREVVVQQQQKVDQTLPLPDLALRWEKLLNLQPKEIQNTDKGLNVSEGASRTTVQTLELVPVLQANLKDSQTVSSNKDKQIDGLNGIVTGKDKQIDGLKVELQDKDKACVAQLDLEKTKAEPISP